MVKHSLIIVYAIIFGSSYGYSQNWVFRITPTVKSNLSLYQSKFEHTESEYFRFGLGRRTALGNVYSDIDPHLDVFLEFFEYNSWSFGVGFGRLSIAQSSQPSGFLFYNQETPDGFTQSSNEFGSAIGTSVYLRQFSLSARKRFLPLRPRLHHSLAGQFNLSYNFVDGEYTGPTPPIISIVGPLLFESYYDAYFDGIGKNDRYQLGLSLRYEVAILSKKGKNLLNVNFTFHHGFFKTQFSSYNWKILVPELSNEPIYARSLTSSRNTTLGLGISKTFTFDVFKNQKNKM